VVPGYTVQQSADWGTLCYTLAKIDSRLRPGTYDTKAKPVG